jgi:hypothetical protein
VWAHHRLRQAQRHRRYDGGCRHRPETCWVCQHDRSQADRFVDWRD